jgi:hypothetical protein
MPYSIDVDQKHHLVTTKFWGVLDLKELQDSMATLDELGPFGKAYRCLQVFQEQLQLDLTADQLRYFAHERSGGLGPKQLPFDLKAKRVVVAPAAVAFGLARLYDAEFYKSGAVLTIVHTITEAAAELGMDAADIDVTFPV